MSRKKREFNLFERGEDKKDESQRVSDISYIDEVVDENSTPEKESDAKRIESEKDYVRHTFIINPNDLVKLKSIVHDVKSTGRYKYSQKEALHDAISLLREKINNSLS